MVGSGITLAYEELGVRGESTIVLVAGLGQQLHSWPDGFCELLLERGHHVVRFDNRDAGRSTHVDVPPPTPVQSLLKRWHPGQYDLSDVAADTVGLLGALELGAVHLVGASMGGMIAQTVAALAPERVRTLTSIMSTTGAPRVGRATPATWARLLSKPATTRGEHQDRAVKMFAHIGSTGYPFDEAEVRRVAGLSWDRDPDLAAGTGRQLAAILRSGDRTSMLRSVTAPTLVIHGDRDPLVNPSGGMATARAIRGARLNVIPGMGHDLPAGAWPELVTLIDSHIQNAPARSPRA
jgi:pimeloyl-ACP methyl ester carboxylesterase